MKRVFTFLSILGTISLGFFLLPVARAFTRDDGTIIFTQPPLLISAKTPYTDTSVWYTTYYFTLQLPSAAGEPLAKVTFSENEGSELIRFDLKDSYAFEGTPEHRGVQLPLVPPQPNERQNPVTVTFNPPVQPGKTITIALRTVRNPLYDGIYLFGVTAFPPGKLADGSFLGYGRLQFYTDGNSD